MRRSECYLSACVEDVAGALLCRINDPITLETARLIVETRVYMTTWFSDEEIEMCEQYLEVCNDV